MSKPKNWEELSEEVPDYLNEWKRAIESAVRSLRRKRELKITIPSRSCGKTIKKDECVKRHEKSEYMRKRYEKARTQADADRFFQMMGAAEELTKIIKQRKDEQTEKMGNNE
jgi:predicted ATPase with chaperone activity